jgi:hypothetical protein
MSGTEPTLERGEIEVLVVSDGVLPLPTAMLGHNADPADDLHHVARQNQFFGTRSDGV